MPATKILFLVLALLLCYESSGTPMTLTLERGRSVMNMTSNELTARDQARHRHLSQPVGVVSLPVGGSSDPYTAGLHYSRVKLGSPPKEYYLYIDTGSNTLWVNCQSCSGCPNSSGLGIELGFFDPRSSSSAAPVPCSDSICDPSSCSYSSQCSYSLDYVDGGISGYYLTDVFYFDTIIGDSSTVKVVFGCTTYHSGSLTRPYRAVDGVLGLGPNPTSFISQLAARRSTPKAFSHCLIGGELGGGTLVIGNVVAPGITYTPLIPSESHYHLNLLAISVGGRTLPIDHTVFATTSTRGTIVDSGTTWAFLVEEAFDQVITAIVAAVPNFVKTFSKDGSRCFQVPSFDKDVFPYIILNFEGGASMLLKPKDYLEQQFDIALQVFCIAFKKSSGLTILGEFVLKDKVIVYDLDRQRLGWVDYNCSLPLNVTASPSSSSPSVAAMYHCFLICIISISTGFLFFV